nr:isoaspartyl peptidase/L-asparaginase [Catalinimonas alkaloidigena]
MTLTSHAQTFGIVVHGGAGTIRRESMTPAQEQAYRQTLEEAINLGYDALARGESSVSAIELTLHHLEDSPLFNAGKGAVFTHEGKNEMDASIMDGKTGNAGAVAGVTNIKHPISAAIKVMNASEHVMLTGTGAETFAKEQGLDIVDPSYFYTERRYQQLQRIIEQEKTELDHDGSGQLTPSPPHKFGTVGAVALDQQGNLAAGTSTGGMTNKRWGRVGDSPIIGAGTYANNATCAISATGHGEYFIRNVVAYDISARMEYKGLSLEEAARQVILDKLEKAKPGSGGIIGIDRKGNITMTFNSEGMYRGYRLKGAKAKVLIYKD